MIPDSKVEEVRAAADIVGVIGEYVSLTRAGREYKALCPFHEERTPSFYVVPHKAIFKCFGCGKSGDVFGFLMEHAGFDFPQAVKHAGKSAGIVVRESRRDNPRDELDKIYVEMNAFAKAWFREALASDEGAVARGYLDSRGIGEDVAERFQLGLAPAGGQQLRKAAARHGYGDEALIEGGLLGESSDGGEPYDRFRERVIFPIDVFGGRTVGFGGRVLPGGSPGAAKYLNSPETRIFKKGTVLYGLAYARNAVRKAKHSLLVEGYMDVVSLAAHALENAVAPLGTTLTDEQARLLVRYAKQVVILFDSDTAGLRATFRAADTLLAAGAHPVIATLPPGEDPDSVVRARGPAYLSRCIEGAVDVLDRKLHMLEEHGFMESIDGRRKAVDRLLPTLRAVRAGDRALRDVYYSQVSERTGVLRETLEAEVEALHPARTGVTGAAPPVPSRARPAATPFTNAGGVERTLLSIMARRADLADEVAEAVSASDLADESHRAIFEVLLDTSEPRVIPDRLGSRTKRLFGEILQDPRDFEEMGDADSRALLEDCVRGVRAASLDRMVGELDRRIRKARDDDEKLRLVRKKISLTEQRREIAPLDWRGPVRSLLITARPT